MNHAKINSKTCKKVKRIKEHLVQVMLPNLNTGCCCCCAAEIDELQSQFSVLGTGKEKKGSSLRTTLVKWERAKKGPLTLPGVHLAGAGSTRRIFLLGTSNGISQKISNYLTLSGTCTPDTCTAGHPSAIYATCISFLFF